MSVTVPTSPDGMTNGTPPLECETAGGRSSLAGCGAGPAGFSRRLPMYHRPTSQILMLSSWRSFAPTKSAARATSGRATSAPHAEPCWKG